MNVSASIQTIKIVIKFRQEISFLSIINIPIIYAGLHTYTFTSFCGIMKERDD